MSDIYTYVCIIITHNSNNMTIIIMITVMIIIIIIMIIMIMIITQLTQNSFASDVETWVLRSYAPSTSSRRTRYGRMSIICRASGTHDIYIYIYICIYMYIHTYTY